ncbi:response regulator [Lachnospiraceae bacterium MD335]|nr:response regulator [Lachnospiraceae bacterium MD335]
MYHCHVCFYFIGNQNQLFEIVRGMPPFSPFVHEFIESVQPQEEFAAKADVLLVDLQGLDAAKAVQTLIGWKKPEADLILLAEQGQFAVFADALEAVTDVWMMPMTDAELRFRFRRWQQNCKTQRDFWQASQYLESTINSVPNLIWYKDKNGIHEKVNDSFCKTVNKTKEQVQGRGHAYIWDVEQDDPACIESERIVMEKEETLVSEEIIQTGEGTRVLTTYKSPLYDWDGSVMGTVGVAIDVTKERAYAQELIKKNQTLEMLFTTMDCGVMCHTLDGSRIISINRAALNILGYQSRAELSRAGFNLVASSVHEEDRSKVEYSIQSLKNVGDSVNLEYRVRHSDGAIVYVLGSFKLVEEDGEVCCQRFLLDRTAEKFQEEEERMRDKRKQMELIQALSIDYNLICFFDLDTGTGKALRIGECKNKILDSVFAGELSWEECMERYIETGIFDEDKETMRCAVSRKQLELELSKKPIFTVNYRITCCGEMRYFQMKVVRVGDWSKNRNVVLGLRSVDEETRSERERNDLLENALLQANRASKAKSIFLSNMSHDIRTPMNAIIGFTALAITHIDRKEQVEEYLKKIMTSGNHLLSLINDVLDMSHIESGKIHLEEEPCSLPDIMHELRNIIQADIHAKQLDLYMDAVDIHNEEICCDRLRLNQVLLNLLSNAVKYTGAGGMVSLKVVEKGGAAAGYANYEFHIKDTGIGMSEEFVAHIFEPFERERNSTISGIQGTGLGMAITKNIVDMMNGTIEVRSKQEFGTECIVSLPLRINGGRKEPQTIPELNGFRALVVDDDFNTCDSVSSMLEQIGLRAEWTLSGKEAVLRTRQAVMRDDQYFIYIIDWLLPDMNGVEVARRIRQETGKDVPIIILTAYDWSDIEDEAREAGVTAFCSKPLFFSELHGCLYSIIKSDIKEEKVEKAKTPLRTGRILLAEDNELNQEIAVAILEEAGFSVEVASNGRIAVDKLKASEPGYYQVVLMDVQMPEMNGYEATRAIRTLENKALASLPVLAMTANAFEEDKQEALRSGMNGHIAKPIDMKTLMEMLDEVLG